MPPFKSRTRPCTRCALRRPEARGAPRGPPPPPPPSLPRAGEAAEGGGGGGAGGGGAGGGERGGGGAMEVPDWDAAETFQALRGGRGYEAGGFETGAGGAGGGAAGGVREQKKRGRAPLPTRRVDLRAVHGCLKAGDEPSGGQGASGSKRRRRERKKRRREGAERGDVEPEFAEGRAKPAPAGGSGDAAAAVNPFRAPAPGLGGGCPGLEAALENAAEAAGRAVPVAERETVHVLGGRGV